MPIDAPQHCQKFRNPAAGPSRGFASGVCGMAPHTMRLMPASRHIGIRSRARSTYGASRSRFASNSSFSASHSGQPPRWVQHSADSAVS